METFTDIRSLPANAAEFPKGAEIPAANPDFTVIASVLDGNVDDFAVLVSKYRMQVFMTVAKRIPVNDVEDVVQEVFIRAFKSINSFSRKNPFANWLGIITLRACCDYWRKNSKRREFTAPAASPKDSEWLELITGETASAQHRKTVNRKELRELLDWTLDKLSGEDRSLIEIIYFENGSISTAAEVLGWGISKTKVRSLRARRKMRAILKQIIQV
ncbi:MAG: RNA polymerase sigma factor [Victivallales bacterium]|nr:RNA polymerase sigma factor [Victivallales bacterium]